MSVICIIRFLFFFFLAISSTQGLSQVTKDESRKASKEIAKWLSKATGHFDFLSATSVASKRAGEKFFGIPDMQMASDYGISYIQVPRDQNVTKAYQTIGTDTSDMERSLTLTRFHLNLGFANKHDVTFSYLTSLQDKVSGWGGGYKRVLVHSGYGYMTYRLNYGQAKKENYFESTTLMNDLSFSLYLRLIDIYAGLRHWSGKVSFDSTIPELQLPEVEYFSSADEIEHYCGIVLATTTNSRLTMEANTIGEKYAFSAKFSLHFDSLLPTSNNWFRDPRYIKQ